MSEARRIDLNADLGEGVTDDPGLLAVVTSANVACGYHAGDVATMTTVCEVAVRHGVVVGAQVSYADRENFGRVALDTGYDELRHHIADQVFTLTRIARRAGLTVAYVKPHGALYNRVVEDETQARAVLDGSGDLPVLGLPGSVLLEMAAQIGRSVWREGFPDRGYTDGPWAGRLLPRDRPGAVLTDPEEVAARAVAMARSGEVDSVCVHGDSPGAVRTARAVRIALEVEGIDVRPV
ncbi:MAG TPA: 5-oxoprolinase subunit PxpA [Nocardioidaceae bacterium]|nr:5-oxoprolinase subunit PxpA [Nocardioidaceae bacterium]